MFWWLILAVAVILLLRLAVYVAQCAWNPFTTRTGRRRAPLWLRGWWRGEQAQNPQPQRLLDLTRPHRASPGAL